MTSKRDHRGAFRVLSSFARVYRQIAIFILNTVVAAAVLNGTASLYLKYVKKRYVDPISVRYGASAAEAAFNLVYPHYTPEQRYLLLKETWTRPIRFMPYTVFCERPFNGVYVNVDKAGFRYSRDQGPWPPSNAFYNIFIFGGSTTFGYGVSDGETIPSRLQEILNSRLSAPFVKVYNFGCNSFFSTQERIFLESLLLQGHRPDLVIFIDGLNEFFYIDNIPKYSDAITRLLDQVVGYSPKDSALFQFVNDMAIVRLMRELVKIRQAAHLGPSQNENNLTEEDIKYFSRPEILNRVLDNYLMNKKLVESVSASFGIETYFVWQPVPSYNFDLKRHPFPQNCKKMFSTFGYPIMRDKWLRGTLGTNFLWAADLHTSAADPVFLDMVHYSPQFSKVMAEYIADHIESRIKKTSEHIPSRP